MRRTPPPVAKRPRRRLGKANRSSSDEDLEEVLAAIEEIWEAFTPADAPQAKADTPTLDAFEGGF